MEPYANRPLEEIFKVQKFVPEQFQLNHKPYHRNSVFTSVDNQIIGVRGEGGGGGCASVPNETFTNSIVLGHQQLIDENLVGATTGTEENNELSFGEASPCRFDSINNLHLETTMKESG